MKNKKFLVLLILFVCISLNLKSDFWIKTIPIPTGQLIVDHLSGDIYILGDGFSKIDLTGMVHFTGQFHTDLNENITLKKTLMVDNESFYSRGFYNKPGTEETRKYFLRYTRKGEILFAKEVGINEREFLVPELLMLNDRIKVIYRDENEYKLFLKILTFSSNGNLLQSKKLEIDDKNNNFNSHHYNCVKLDPDNYVIVIHGTNVDKTGFYLIQLNKYDDIQKSKFCYYKTSYGWYGDLIIKKDKDNNFTILMKREECQEIHCPNESRTYTLCLLKIDSDWSLVWSKEYRPKQDYKSLSLGDIFQDEAGHVIGFNKYLESENGPLFNTLLLGIDNNGSVIWSRQSSAQGSQYQHFMGLVSLPVGIGLTCHESRYYLMDRDGLIPGSCPIPVNVEMNGQDINFSIKSINGDIFKLSGISISVTDTDIRFTNSSNSDSNPICHYPTMEGRLKSFGERSMFAGYNVDKIGFTVDSRILPHIKKFKIYNQLHTDQDYVYLAEVNSQQGITNYRMEFQSYGQTKYKIMAINANNQVVDMIYIE